MDAAALARLGAAAAAADPISRELDGDRVLLIDADAAAYYCSGSDDTPAGKARNNLHELVASTARATGAGQVKLLFTSSGSHKGYRYAVARTKGYQAQRSNNRRPQNWRMLRELLEGNEIPGAQVISTDTAEADDLFGKFSRVHGAGNTFIMCQDKDMRMVPGWHIRWAERDSTFVPEGTWEKVWNEKVYGRKWFWLQMLHGDSADYIPGLERYVKPNGVSALCGPATADKLIAGIDNEADCRDAVIGLYAGWYEDEWAVRLAEQAVLLWMRNDLASSWTNVLDEGNPLHGVKEMTRAFEELADRIRGANGTP
jgi:hypothetical protein